MTKVLPAEFIETDRAVGRIGLTGLLPPTALALKWAPPATVKMNCIALGRTQYPPRSTSLLPRE